MAEVEVYIPYRNKDKGYQEDRKYFKGKDYADAFDKAKKWGMKEFDNWSSDYADTITEVESQEEDELIFLFRDVESDINDVIKDLKFPKGGKSKGVFNDDEASWNKYGGSQGKKTVERVKENAKNLGWSENFKQDHHPADTYVANQWKLYSPDGEWELTANTHYGQTSSQNSFSLRLKRLKKSKQLNINKNQKKSKAMAKKETGTTTTKNVRTNAILEGRGKKGVAFILLRDAYNAEARRHKQRSKETGVRDGHSFAGSEQLMGSTLPSAVFARAGKEGTEYWSIKESDPRFVSFVSALKSAGADGLKNWDSKAAAAMNEFLAIKGERSARTGLTSDKVDNLLGSL